MSSRSADPARQPYGPVRRQVLTNITVEHDIIEDVLIGGRTPSPFTSSMGAHGTAWVAHIDRMRRVILGRSVREAGRQLVVLTDEELKSPLLELDVIDAKHRASLAAATISLKTTRTALDAQSKDASITGAVLLQTLRQHIDRLMTYMNYLPTATVLGGDPGGHGEGSARSGLNAFEFLAAKVDAGAARAEIDQHLKGVKGTTFTKMLKTQAPKKFTPADKRLQTELTELLWTMFAAETPTVVSKDNPTVKPILIWQTMLAEFLSTIRASYPYAFRYTEMEKPKSQEAGLDLALTDIDPQPDKATLTGVKKWLSTKVSTPAAPRRTATGPSDLRGASTAFSATVFLGANGKVADIAMIGRTKSPFSGTMGRHTIAWAAHLDAVRASLVGRSPLAALDYLREMSSELVTDDRLDFSSLTDEKQQHLMAGFWDELKRQIKRSEAIYDAAPPKPDTTVLGQLEILVGAYLSLENVLPMSTLDAGTVPGGRNEGRHRTFLLKFERDSQDGVAIPVAVTGAVFDHIMGMWDGAPLSSVAKPGDYDEDDVDIANDHKLWAHFRKVADPSTVAGSMFDEFKKIIRTAYPHAYAAAEKQLNAQTPDDAMEDDESDYEEDDADSSQPMDED